MGQIGHGYGSEWHLLRYMGRHRDYFNRTVLCGIKVGSEIEWLDFTLEANGSERELKGLEFLDLSRYQDVTNEWNNFWPQAGNPQNWDAVGWLRSRGTWEVLLVEAKAHVSELKSSTGASEDSKQIIIRAMEDVQQNLGVHSANCWMQEYYQYANRLVVLNFLNEHGIPARLINVYFVGDRFGDAPTTVQEWEQPIRNMKQYLGLPDRHKWHDRIHDIFLEVK